MIKTQFSNLAFGLTWPKDSLHDLRPVIAVVIQLSPDLQMPKLVKLECPHSKEQHNQFWHENSHETTQAFDWVSSEVVWYENSSPHKGNVVFSHYLLLLKASFP